jgi:hypothetical protein
MARRVLSGLTMLVVLHLVPKCPTAAIIRVAERVRFVTSALGVHLSRLV